MYELVAGAAAALRPLFGDDVALDEPRLLRDGERNTVVRCRLAASGSSVASVVVKYLKHDPELGFNEWASLRFLGTRAEAAPLVPRVIAGDVSSRIVILEDLGAGGTLHDVLMGEDAEAARRTLRELARQTARLHAATMANPSDHDGMEGDFGRVRRALPIAASVGRAAEARDWTRKLDRLDAWFDEAGCPLPSEAGRALERVAEVYADPGPFLAFTHGDPAPSNYHVSGHDVRLLDFEYGAYRHALYDLTAWNVLCPLPTDVVGDMRAAYRAVLAESREAARDDAAYREAWACLTAYRAVWRLVAVGMSVFDEDRPGVDAWTCRAAALAAAERMALATLDAGELAALAEPSARLHETLRSRWPDVTDLLPSWPAL